MSALGGPTPSSLLPATPGARFHPEKHAARPQLSPLLNEQAPAGKAVRVTLRSTHRYAVRAETGHYSSYIPQIRLLVTRTLDFCHSQRLRSRSTAAPLTAADGALVAVLLSSAICSCLLPTAIPGSQTCAQHVAVPHCYLQMASSGPYVSHPLLAWCSRVAQLDDVSAYQLHQLHQSAHFGQS